MFKYLLLIILCPFTAWLPIVGQMFKVIESRKPIITNPINIGLLGLFGWSVISSFVNRDILSLAYSFVFLGYYAISVFLKEKYDTPEKLHEMIVAIWKISLVSSLIGIVEKLISHYYDISGYVKLYWNPTFFPTQGDYRILSTFGNPNVAGDWFAMMILVSLYLLDYSKNSKRMKIVYGISSMLFVVCLVLTGSKGAFGSFIVSILIYCMMKNSSTLWKAITVLLGFSVGLLVMFKDVFLKFNSRDLIWKKCAYLFSQKPLTGWGIMGIYGQIQEVHAHNMMISIAVSLGIVGFIIMCYIILHTLKNGILLVKSKAPMSPLFFSCFILIFCHGFIDFTVLAPQIGIVFFSTLHIIELISKEEYRYSFPSLNFGLQESYSNVRYNVKI